MSQVSIWSTKHSIDQSCRMNLPLSPQLQYRLQRLGEQEPDGGLRVTALLVLALRYLNRPVLAQAAFYTACSTMPLHSTDRTLLCEIQHEFFMTLSHYCSERVCSSHLFGWEVVQVFPTVLVVVSYRRLKYERQTVETLIKTPNKRNTGWRNTPLLDVAML